MRLMAGQGATPALAQTSPGEGPRLLVIRDAETETLLRTLANPLFRAAGLDANLIRIILIRDDAINSFVSTGNRMFIHTGPIEWADSALVLAGVIAHETGHVAHGDLAKLPEAMRAAMLQRDPALPGGAIAELQIAVTTEPADALSWPQLGIEGPARRHPAGELCHWPRKPCSAMILKWQKVSPAVP